MQLSKVTLAVAAALGALAIASLSACGSGADASASSSAAVSAAAGPSGSSPGASASLSSPAPAASSSAAGSGSPAASGSASAASVTADGVTVSGAAGSAPQIMVTPGAAAPTSLVAVDVYPGTGKELKAGGSGTFNYTGELFSDGSVFDSSWERGQPISLTLDRVIPGWRDGVVGMKAGGRRLLIVPPDQGYGAKAIAGIPPNSTLVFVVDLEEVTS